MESIRRDPIGEFGLSDRVFSAGGMKVRNTTAFLASLQSILNKILPHESEATAKGRWKWMSKSLHRTQRKKSARLNCDDLQEAGHGHSARRSLILHGDSGVRTEVAAMKKFSLARYFQSMIVKSEVLEF